MMQRRSSEHCEAETAVAQRVYNVLFPGKIPSELRARFEQAWWLLQHRYTEQEQAGCEKAVNRVKDLEALELTCRRKKLLPMLTDQVVLMSFLSETLPEHYVHYIDPQAGRVKAYFSLAFGVFRSAVKYAKGTFLRQGIYDG